MSAVGLYVNGVIEILLLWVFVLANLFGFLLSALGGALGGMIAGVPKPMDRKKQQPENVFHEAAASVYVICPACGHSNGEKDEYCRNCGKRILV
jgi:ribosomal protein L40E